MADHSKDKTNLSSPEERLPFEPKKNRKKVEKSSSNTSAKQPERNDRSTAVESTERATLQATRIPDIVSKRMIRRIIIFCGIPSALGLSTFFISYWIVTKGWFDIPNYVVLLVSLGLFGLGTLGLSYGLLSASWDEEIPGSFLGFQEFRINLKRFLDSRKAQRQTTSVNTQD